MIAIVLPHGLRVSRLHPTSKASAAATTVTEDTYGRVAVTATASAVATGVTIPAAPTESASRSRTGGRNCETHAEDCYR